MDLRICSRHFLPCPPLPGAQGPPHHPSRSARLPDQERLPRPTCLIRLVSFCLPCRFIVSHRRVLSPSSYTRPAPRSSHSTWSRSSKRPPSYSVPCRVIARRMGPDRSSCISHMYAARSTQASGTDSSSQISKSASNSISLVLRQANGNEGGAKHRRESRCIPLYFLQHRRQLQHQTCTLGSMSSHLSETRTAYRPKGRAACLWMDKLEARQG